ncbi:MAG: amidase [Candidatus Marinimicrobia bacterium]|nr:amidase [Candidatus Neomarinimicrobiota bacterium]MBL7010491.1 amidase [Candidatus Neomarinimicrobiota bacterium]MBL7030930.1 amidase [Candidatus Neomarinimicrobiota bacterium]
MLKSATQILASIRKGDLSSVEVLTEHLNRIDQINPNINAVVQLDVDRAMKRAKIADEATAKGESWGPLHGLPITVKDAFEVEGIISTGGAPVWKDYIPKANAEAVEKLVDAGAIIFGKTNVPLFSGDVQAFNDIYGTTNNPWDITKTSGGSSGGAAAAVASGMSPVELGSDIGGSIRTPAHFCGVFGHKPTHGIIPMIGHLPPPPGATAGEDTLAVVGPLARSAEDLELMMNVLAGPNKSLSKGWHLKLPPARHKKLSDFKIGLWLDDPYCPVDEETVNLIQNTVDQVDKTGATVNDMQPDFSLEMNDIIYGQLLAPVMATGFPKKVIERMKDELSNLHSTDQSPRSHQIRNSLISHKDWLSANGKRHQIKQKWADYFNDLDVILCPTTIRPAFDHDHQPDFHSRRIDVNGKKRHYTDLFIWAGLASTAQLPSTNVPIGFSKNGPPIGMQVIGPYLEDWITIEFAKQISEITGGFPSPPD